MTAHLLSRLLLAGLLAVSVLLTPIPLTLDPPSAHADPGDWPMFRHNPAQRPS